MNVMLLQAAPGAQPGGQWAFPGMMLLMVVVMYFFMIRPQAKKAKEQKKFAETIGAGEQIVTTAGIHGRIAKVNDDDTLKLEVSNNNFITIDRAAVSMDMTAAFRKKSGATAPATK